MNYEQKPTRRTRLDSFVYTGLPARVIFGVGTVDRLGEEVEALGVDRALVLTTSAQAAEGRAVVERLGACTAGLFAEAVMHTPVDVTQRALRVFEETGANGVVSIGGGSTIGLGKAIALRTDTPQLVLPTTYAGSEMTPIIGETRDGEKITQKTAKVLPETVIYDVNYTLGLPPKMSVTSGMNAIAHAVEALYAENANPVLSLMAEEGIAALAGALPKIGATPNDPTVRSDALYGAWLCAVCLGTGGVALHHKLCHVLGGSFDLPHAETHTIVLPHALSYNAPAVEPAMVQLRRALKTDAPAAALYDLAQNGGAPSGLKDLGMPESGVDKAVDITLKNPYWNPRPFEADAIRDIIRAAWVGERPQC